MAPGIIPREVSVRPSLAFIAVTQKRDVHMPGHPNILQELTQNKHMQIADSHLSTAQAIRYHANFRKDDLPNDTRQQQDHSHNVVPSVQQLSP